ncbi:MAG: sulfatase-like hydrolase/transferase [Planctomycetes bacterium]|nr:sulfatase-like hydrolase/transferase [Planctomycetota bacterium]
MIFRVLLSLFAFNCFAVSESSKPHVVLVMADDQGWGQTGYRGHPHLKTPNINAMARNGLRFERFYAGSAVCSPTRASVLTGRNACRSGVPHHGYRIRLQEKFLPQAMKKMGYATGHFGKLHLSGIEGCGVPIMPGSTRFPSPEHLGFDTWLSSTNFFDIDPILSRNGKIEEFKGDSSEIIVAEALKFIAEQEKENRPSFSVIWYGSPHGPMEASSEDRAQFEHLNDSYLANHLGELVAMDRSIGQLRSGLRDLGIHENTLVWYNSDNGGLVKVDKHSVGDLRGYKNNLYEGGIRVPALIEWPANIPARISHMPASTMDIFPTLMALLGGDEETMLKPLDGESILGHLLGKSNERKQPIPFSHGGVTVLIDGSWKLMLNRNNEHELYHLEKDPQEKNNVQEEYPEVVDRLAKGITAFSQSLEASVSGFDYAENRLVSPDKKRIEWANVPEYMEYLKDYMGREDIINRIAQVKRKDKKQRKQNK